MNTAKLRFFIFMIAASLIAACSAGAAPPTPNITLPTPAGEIVQTVPASQEALTSASPYPIETLKPTPFLPPVETLSTAYPESAATLSATQMIVIPPSVYTCDLDGTDLPVWRFKVIQSFPHDSNAYTQGLIYRNGILYEGTGLRGRSSLRKVSLETGEVLQKIDLPQQYFGEGITELDGKLYQITWEEKIGLIYDFSSLKQVGDFSYETEGWGITQDGLRLIMSDGSDQLFFINPGDMRVTGQVAVSDNRGPIYWINELEFVDGEVWGNIYQTACIVRIDADSGQATGWIDLTGLHDLALQDSQAPVPPEVPNGIAYDPSSKRIFVTGKFWPTLYEITLIPAETQP